MKVKHFFVFMMVGLLSFAVPAFGSQPPLASTAAKASSAAEILSLGDFLATHQLQDREKESTINRSFLRAVRAWMGHDYPEAKRMFREHVADYPDSPWAAEAYLHLGSDAINNMRFAEAEDVFNKVILQNRERDSETAKILSNRARIGLGNVKMNQHNLGEAKRIFADLSVTGSDWRERTYAGHWLHQLSGYEGKKREMRNCGAWALAYLIEKEGEKEDAAEIRELLPATEEGHSLKELYDIAADYGYDLDVLRMAPEKIRELPLPAVMHVKNHTEGDIGHFWILNRVEGDILTFFVAKEGLQFQQSFDEFLKEWSGAVLLLAGDNPKEHALTDGEMAAVFGGNGGGDGGSRYEDSLGDCKDKECKQGPSAAGTRSSRGAPTWFVNMVNFNLHVTDTPLWYASPVGPPVEVKLSYNSQSALAANEPFGNKWQFNYASYMDVTSGGQAVVFMPDGKRDVYLPDGSGGYTRPYAVFNTLTQISQSNFQLSLPDGTAYIYEIPPQLTSPFLLLTRIRNAYSQQLTFGYDQNRRLTTIADAAGKVTTLTYNSNGLVTQVSDPFGRSATFLYDINRNLIKMTDMGGYWSSFTYDANVYLKNITNAAGAWGFTIEPSDSALSWTYPAPGAPMGDNYRVTVTNPAGGKEEYFYNSLGVQGYYVSPANYVPYLDGTTNNHAMANKTVYSYPSSVTRRGEIGTITYPTYGGTIYAYDSNGNVTSETDRSGHVTTYTYNAMGRPTTVTDPKGTLTTLTYAANNLDLGWITNGLGTTALTYNTSHDITSITDRTGNSTAFAFNAFGQLSSATDELNIATNYLYDANHFLTQVTRDGKTLKSFTYDAVGRTKTFTDENGLTVTLAYNDLNDITRVTWPDGKFINISYSTSIPHQVTSVTDRAGRTTQYSYNLLQQPTQVVNAEPGTVTFERDGNGNMVRFTDTRGNATTFAYDANDRLIGKTYADGTFVPYTYTVDNLPSQAEGKVFSYDQNHNATGYDTGGTFAFDAFNRRTTMQQRDDITAGTTGYAYVYDANFRVTSIDGPLANDTVSFLYDAKGRLTGLSVQGGQTVTYSYDSLDRITKVENPDGAYTYTYSAASPLPQKLTRPNGSYTDYQYDTLKRLASISNKTAAGAVISSYVYTYDNQDLRASETISGGAPVGSFNYESATFTANNLNQLVTSDGPYIHATYSYDTDGSMNRENLLDGIDTSFLYRDNRLYKASHTRDTYYSYNGDDFLIKKQVKNGTLVENETNYVRLGALVLQERDANNAVIRDYTWGTNMGGGIGGLLNLKQAGQNYSYLYDGKGNVTSVINSSQAVAAAYSYDPFGNLMARVGTLDQPYMFSTKTHDDNTGLYYYGYRFYQPSNGRWINRDPIREQGGLNLYAFVENNPVNYIDRNGLDGTGDGPVCKAPETPKEQPKKVSGKRCGYSWTEYYRDHVKPPKLQNPEYTGHLIRN